MYFVCVILFCYVIATTTATGLNPRSVNLNLETVLQFDPKDNSADVKFINHIQRFLGKVKTVIDNKPSRRSHGSYLTPEAIKFTNFIKNAILILKTYSDEDLQDVISVIDHEIRKYHYKGCKFHELIQNEDLRRYVASKLSTVQNQDGKYIKKSLSELLDALDDAKFDYKHSELLDYIDSLYRNNDVSKMKTFLNQLKTYGVKSKRANLDLIRVVRNGIRSLVFDHYTNLNPNARRELRIRLESFWHRDTDGTTTEATTTKKKFDIANSFNFLRDFTFEFITPETYTKTTEYTTKPTESSHSIEEFVDETRLKKNKSPEVMPNYSDNEEMKENKSAEKSKKSAEKSKKKEKKKNKHKKKKEHKKKRSRVTVADENLAPKRKNKSKKHKGELVFRQQDVQPMNVFDYEAVINVRGQTDLSNSNEIWNPNESISSSDRDKLNSKNFRPEHFRKNIAKDSEEGLSIDFTPSAMHLSLNTEPTTKKDDVLVRRLNNLEQVVETFQSKTVNDDNEDIKVTRNIIQEKPTTDEATEIYESPAERRSPVALPYIQNTERTPFWQKRSQQFQDIETVTKRRKPPLFLRYSSTIETMPTEQRQSHQFRNIETTPAWLHQPYKPTINYDGPIETIPTGQRQSQQFRNIETMPAWKQQSHKPTINYDSTIEPTGQRQSQQFRNIKTIPGWKQQSYKPTINHDSTIEPTGQRQSQQFRNIETMPAWKQQSHKPTINYENNPSETTTEEIYTTTPKVIENQSQYDDIANTTDQPYFRTNLNDSNEVIQRANNLPNKNYSNPENNDIDNVNFDKFIGTFNMSKDLLDRFKENFNNITIMTTNDIPTVYKANEKGEDNENKNNENSEIINTSDGTNYIITRKVANASNESSSTKVKIREKLQKNMESILEKQSEGSSIVNAIEGTNSLIHEFDI